MANCLKSSVIVFYFGPEFSPQHLSEILIQIYTLSRSVAKKGCGMVNSVAKLEDI